MDPKKIQHIGPYNAKVTQMSMGGTTFGNMYSAVEERTAMEVIAAAYTLGMRYFDTAPLYGYGLSETRLGTGLSHFDRDQITFSTKVGYTLVPRAHGETTDAPFANTPPFKTVFDFSRDAVLRSIDTSLERLQTDRIDILLIHDPDEGLTLKPDNTDPYAVSHFDQVMAETYPVLHELREQKVVKAIGLGMNQWQMLADFARAGDFDCFLLAGRYTLLEQEPLAELLPLCQEKDIRIIVGGPYNSGILATGAVKGAYYNYAPAPEPIVERVQGIQQVCARHEVPLQAAALQFPFGHPSIAAIIPGARTVVELENNGGFFRHVIPAQCWDELKHEKLIDANAPVPQEG
jgi:D-threo-aldose 1-dehydrogenase